MSKKLELAPDTSMICNQRIVVEICEFDWIFEDSNAANMIVMLSE